MFCPLCKADYSRQLLQCPQCGVPLFHSKEEGERAFPTAVLWEGDHPDFFDALLSELAQAGVPHCGKKRGGSYFGALDVPRFSVIVPEWEVRRAQRLLDEVQAGYEVDENAALGVQRTIRLKGVPGQDTFGDWDNEERALEVWSGTNTALASGLRDCLRENEIAYRTERGSSVDAERILVRPEDAPRARAIISEVLEATPPP